MNTRGFTVIELLAATVLLIMIGIVFWTQTNSIQTALRDDKRKIAINAMYYSLEEVYHKTNGDYPKLLSASTLPSVDKNLFNDPNGNTLGEASSDYRYQGTNCTGDTCQSYTLRSKLESEADYVKKSRND